MPVVRFQREDTDAVAILRETLRYAVSDNLARVNFYGLKKMTQALLPRMAEPQTSCAAPQARGVVT